MIWVVDPDHQVFYTRGDWKIVYHLRKEPKVLRSGFGGRF
jgi:hypothetical protein